MIFVYQMAKVASRSWLEATKLSSAATTAPPHCHYMLPASRDLLETVFSLPNGRQTIANLLLPHNLLRTGATAWKALCCERDQGRKVKVITGFRDPVARSISVLMFMIDFYGHVRLPLKPNASLCAKQVIEFLHGTWDAVLTQCEPDCSFEWLAWYMTGGFQTWFQDELGATFGIDIVGLPRFAPGARARLYTRSADILFYRVEDMDPHAPGYAHTLAMANEFLGTSLEGLPRINTSETRRSGSLTMEVRQGFRLAQSALDAIYGNATVRWFFAPHEIERLRRSWSRP